ncbi:carboxypeptidase-like regulatory domain-containing protein [Cytophagales bacterium LB-30]|uniref:Carboxypeptidase-like regulatory domain-containing protein n=1 Tax=Shiella aurantiaca TaxID=3058365 RepID=A0ABT8F5K7_9BACT|nr:carboxypeptidase-like regulatory domain-containing protein [Shiella aurantiaca]MDN4165506.1 carboxypeptidase-like regulatory domain-containing protein [Shiella aurantiaca]
MKTLLITGFLLFPLLLAAQVRGIVTDKKGEPLLGANVYLKGTYVGATTSFTGEFSFPTTLKGAQVLVVSFTGYESQELPLQLNGPSEYLRISLKEAFNKLEAVTITAGAFEASDTKKVTVLKPLDIVTTPSAVGDINGALQTLPGTTQNGESGRLFVRGGDGYETQTYINGTLVQNPYGSALPNLPTRGRFSPFMFSGTTFSTGGYSAEFGQALSSALVLQTNAFPTESKTEISLMTVGGDIAHTQAGERTAASAKLGYIHLGPYQALVPQQVLWTQAPQEYRGETSFYQKFGKTGLLKAYAQASSNSVEIERSRLEQADSRYGIALDNDFQFVNLSYQMAVGKRATWESGLSLSSNHDSLHPDTLAIEEKERSFHLKNVWLIDWTERFSTRLGSEFIGSQYEQDIQAKELPVYATELSGGLSALFAEADVYLTQRLAARIGLRAEHTNVNQQLTIAPRTSLAYKWDEFSQISFAYGSFYQKPQNAYWALNESLDQEKAEHYILNVQRIKNKRTLRVEAYYKNYHSLVRFDAAQRYQPAAYTNTGHGYAQGIELFWRDQKSIPRTDYWLSYSYLDTERLYRDYPQKAMPTFAAKHSVSLVVKHFISALRTQVGASYSVGSGRPYYNPENPTFLGDKAKPYMDLSMNVAYLLRPQVILYTSVSNVTGYQNVFGYEYAAQPNAQGIYPRRAIGQAAPRFFFVGLFITLSSNKNDNQLNNL